MSLTELFNNGIFMLYPYAHTKAHFLLDNTFFSDTICATVRVYLYWGERSRTPGFLFREKGTLFLTQGCSFLSMSNHSFHDSLAAVNTTIQDWTPKQRKRKGLNVQLWANAFNWSILRHSADSKCTKQQDLLYVWCYIHTMIYFDCDILYQDLILQPANYAKLLLWFWCRMILLIISVSKWENKWCLH